MDALAARPSVGAGRVTARAIPTALREAAAAGSGALVFHLAGGAVRWSGADLVDAAEVAAGVLAAIGVGPGRRVGLVGPTDPRWVVAALAVWRLGAVLVPLPLPITRRDAARLEEATALARIADCALVLAPPAMLGHLPTGQGVDWTLAGRGARALPAPPDAEALAVIQFTSGSTAAPKAVRLRHRAVVDTVRATAASLDLVAGRDRLLGWLPLFHDYGLFGFVVRALVVGMECHLLPTERFAADPALWLRLIGDTGATMTAGPTSGWGHAVRLAEASGAPVRLDSLRAAVMAAEAIDPAVVDRVLAYGQSRGLAGGALSGAYGLAECTLGVTGVPAGGGMRVLALDRERLARDGLAVVTAVNPRRVASCGRPMRDTEVRVVGTEGTRPDGVIGEIEVRGPGLMDGYLSTGGAGEAASPFRDGWLRTGDLGFLDRGELFVTGRSKDLVIVLGRNLHPEDMEQTAAAVAGVRAGRVVAFAAPEGGAGEGAPVVLVEPTTDAPGDLAARVRRAVADGAGVLPSVVVVPPGTIRKTTSGKQRRAHMREWLASRRVAVHPSDPP
ncbi:MAG: AMP-binding protein [Ectothiorhodospiraceae bacterium]|nr:AMP-binding protein [Ectothiorhodospiraceae bacterium]